MSLKRLVGWTALALLSVALAVPAPLAAPVETLTLDLAPEAKGGTFELSWGGAKLAAPFEIAK